jgi:hypothetical protein
MSLKNIVLIFLLTLFSATSFAEVKKPNRLILEELGYSTATGGFIAFGVGRAINDKSVVSAFMGSWSHASGNYYGVGHKYYFQKQSNHSWFFYTDLRKKEIYHGELTDSTTLTLFAGHQWVFGEIVGLELQSGLGGSDLSGIFFSPFNMSFSIRF